MRLGVCATCGSQFESGSRGVVGSCCTTCRVSRQHTASNAWKRRNADQQLAYERTPKQRAKNIERSRRNRALRDPEVVRAYRRNLYETKQRETSAAVMADYRRRHPGKQAEYENRRRARLLGAFVAPVDPASIRDRDGGICGICSQFVEPLVQSLDHIIALANGGTHEPANVQLAHRVCNSRKGARQAA